ncbi:hypothetical protein N0V90_010096 [Kalmusia sp. IMI 367209]|nr:hypothetical protein N0V90_010096 [Kalmusia sp. IMI 367209]
MSTTATTNTRVKETQKDTLDVFDHLKDMILSNAKLTHGGSINGRPRHYDIVTSSRFRSQNQYRVMLIGYEDTQKAMGKVDVDSKVLTKSAVKLNLNLAMEDLLKKTQEDLWKD